MKILFGLLLALLPSSVIGVPAKEPIQSSEKPCQIGAWVRAPDLKPGQVVQGDVKVKLDGTCEEVISYTLKLRFSERSWVKTRRQGVQPPLPAVHPTPNCTGDWFGLFGSNRSWYNEVVDHSSWLVREEERIGFEIKYNLCGGKQISHNVVESFAILVPSTVYPPAYNPLGWSMGPYDRDDAQGEHIYAYIVDVAFVNGTTREVPAGYTSFNAPTVITQSPETVNVTVSQPTAWHANDHMASVVESEDVDTFTLEVTFPRGRHLEQGSINNITIVSHQVGPGILRPNRILWLNASPFQKRHWAASFAAHNTTTQSLLMTTGMNHASQIRPTADLTIDGTSQEMSFFGHYDNDLTNPMFPQCGTVPGGTTFSTEPITAQFYLQEDFYPHFDMHYETSRADLHINMHVQNGSTSKEEDTEEYDWIPTTRQSNYDRNPPQVLSFMIPIFVHPKQDDLSGPAINGVHYLSPKARAPVFVAPGSVRDLLQKSIDERDSLSPKAQPSFITHEGEDAVKDRYFVWNELLKLHYVGNTWLRKVILPRKENNEPTAVLMVQS